MSAEPDAPGSPSSPPEGEGLATFAGDAANAWLAAIIASSDDAIVSKTLDGIVTTWNGAAERMFGWTAAEMIGQSIRRLIPAERQSEEDQVLGEIRRGGRVDHFETIRQRKDGSLVEISLSVSPIVDASGKVIGASKVARDITERKNAERALQESVAIKDQFLSLVSHELRTPISIILGNGHLLQKRDGVLSAEEKARSLADITFHAERLQRIIENLLLLTRAEAEQTFELEVLHIRRVIDETVAGFKQRNPGRHVFVTTEDDIPPVVGEATITAMVIENLLNNAAKYSPLTEAVEVRIQRASDWVEVHVLDRGIGIPEADMNRIFSPFFRSPAAAERAGGMGLGLAVCRKVVEAQGGEITAAPREGGGTDFCFTLQVVHDPGH